MSGSAEDTGRPGDGPRQTPVALDLPDTAKGLRRYRSKAAYMINAGAAMLAAGVTLVALSSWNGPLADTLAPWLLGIGLAVLPMGLLAFLRFRRMRRILGAAPWVAHASVATPLGSGAPAVVLAGGPGGDELLVLVPRTIPARYHLVSGPEGVLWWCGDARTGGVLAPPGGRDLILAGPLGARRSRRILSRTAVRNLPHRPVPNQPQPWPGGPEAGGPGVVPSSPPALPVERKHRPWWRGVFRYLLLVGFMAVALANVWSDRADTDPQIDLTVISGQSDGSCVVRWTGPFDGRRHTGPYHCDLGRDPVPGDWESGFIVSAGPWKGDLYDAELRGTPTFAVMDTLGIGGLLLILAGGVGGAVRVSRTVRARQAQSRSRTGYVQRSGASVLWPAARVPAAPAPLCYAAFAAEAERQAAYRGPAVSKRRPDTSARMAPWWLVPALVHISQIFRPVVPLGYALVVGLVSLLWPGSTSGHAQIFGVLAGIVGLLNLVQALRKGVPYARELSRNAVAPYRELKRYVLLFERSGTGPGPLLLLFPADAGDDSPPDSLLRLRAPASAVRPWRGLPAAVGTAELRGRLYDEPPLAMAWIEGRPYWPQGEYEKLDLTVLTTRRALEELLAARA